MDNDGYDLGDLLRSLTQGLMYALPVALLAALLTYFVGQRLEPVYQAETTVIAAQSNVASATNNAALLTTPLSADAYEAVLLSDGVIGDMLNDIGATSVDQRLIKEIRDHVNISTTEDTRFRLATLFDISYRNASPAVAAEVVNALAQSFIDWDQARARSNVQQSIATLERQLEALEEDIQSLRLRADAASQEELSGRLVLKAQQQQELFYARALRNSASGLLSVIQPAAAPLTPVAPRPSRYAALAFIGAVVLVLGLRLLFNALDSRVRSADDIRAVSGLPVLAQLGKQRGRHAAGTVDMLRANLYQERASEPSKVLLVTSPASLRAKTMLATELACSFSLSGYRTLLIDLDSTNPVGTVMSKIASRTSLTLDEMPADPDYTPPPPRSSHAEKTLSVVTLAQSRENMVGYLGRSFREALEHWQSRFDVIVISGLPVLGYADTLTIAPMSHEVVMAVNLGATDRRSLRVATEYLEDIGVENLGAVAVHGDSASLPAAAGPAQAVHDTELKVSELRR